MSAIVIPFKPRADAVAPAVAPANSTAQLIEFPTRRYSLTADDIAALEALAPILDGVWTCEILVKDNGDRWAVFEGHHAPPLMFFIGRRGAWLRLFDMDGEAVVDAEVGEMTAILGNAIGRLVASV